MIENNFQELTTVNTKSFEFWRRYINEGLKYLFTWFFFEAPIYKWHTFLASAHRIAWDCTRAKIAIENEKDCFNKQALKSRFLRWGESKLNGN